MSVARLMRGDVAGYFDENADRPGTLWVFQHIPKTAGSSFRAEVAQTLKPQANIARNGMGGRKFDSVQDALNVFLDELPRRKYRFASGHMVRAQVGTIARAHDPVRIATMLRHPVDRVISDYRYQRTPKHGGSQKFIEQFPDFETYLEARQSQNRIFEFLQKGPDSTPADVIADLEENYAFVGITEMYPLSRRLLFSLLGIENAEPLPPRNKTEANAVNEIPGLEALLPRVRELNGKDMEIFRHFQAGIREQRATLVEALKKRRVALRRRNKNE